MSLRKTVEELLNSGLINRSNLSKAMQPDGTTAYSRTYVSRKMIRSRLNGKDIDRIATLLKLK